MASAAVGKLFLLTHDQNLTEHSPCSRILLFHFSTISQKCAKMIVLSRCVGVQAKNEQVPQGTNSGIFWAKYRKINYFAHNLSLNLPEDDREAWNQT